MKSFILSILAVFVFCHPVLAFTVGYSGGWCLPYEATETTCDDGCDNDRDGDMDGADSDCAGGEPCNPAIYDIQAGDNESFEASEGAFCTANVTESDTDGVISTYDATNHHCGTHVLSIISDSDSSNENTVVADLGSADADFYSRFYVWLPAMSSGAYIRFYCAGSTSGSNATFFVQWYNSSGTYQLKVRTGAGQPTDYFVLTPGAKYRVEMHHVQYPGNTTLKVWDSTGTAVQASDSDYEVVYATANQNLQYMSFWDFGSSSTAYTTYVEDWKIDVDAVDYIGAQTCQ
jgi:hypothetical protein